MNLGVIIFMRSGLGSMAYCLLPPANEVRGKVICLQVCVCPQGVAWSRGGVWSQGVFGPGGCLVPGVAWSWGCLVPGVPGPGGAWSQGCLIWGVPGPRGVSGGGSGGDPPGRLLLRAVRILLECILVMSNISHCNLCENLNGTRNLTNG